MSNEALEFIAIIIFRYVSCWIIPKQDVWWQTVVPSFTEEDFIAHFRVDRSAFEYLVNSLKSDLLRKDTKFRQALPVDLRVAVGLKTLATNSDYMTLGSLFGIGKTSVMRCFKEFCAAVERRLSTTHIRWPKNEEFEEKSKAFEKLWQFPRAVGAIDGCHFPVIVPDELTTDYYNFKGWYSVSALVICDAKYRAMYVKSGIPGRCNDAGAFKTTAIYDKAVKGELFPKETVQIQGTQIPYFLLGDSAFSLENWLMKPFVNRESLNTEQKLFNKRHSRARRVIENYFGRLKGRFRRLMKRMDVTLEDVPMIINAAVVLTNICEERKFPVESNAVDEEEGEYQQPTSCDVMDTSPKENAKQIRNALMKELCSQKQPWNDK